MAVPRKQPEVQTSLGKAVLAYQSDGIVRFVETDIERDIYLAVWRQRESDHWYKESGNSVDWQLLFQPFSCIVGKSVEHLQSLRDAEIVRNIVAYRSLLFSPLLPFLDVRNVVADQDLFFLVVTLNESNILSD